MSRATGMDPSDYGIGKMAPGSPSWLKLRSCVRRTKGAWEQRRRSPGPHMGHGHNSGDLPNKGLQACLRAPQL